MSQLQPCKPTGTVRCRCCSYTPATKLHSDLFDQEAYSDVTIKFGDREVRCHKIILCSNSDYFKTLCGPDSSFGERGQSTIELKDDDPDAVHAMLRYLYTFAYEADRNKVTQDALYHLNVHIAGDEYGLDRLRQAAWTTFEGLVTKAEDDSRFKIIKHVLTSMKQHADLVVWAEEQIVRHMRGLLKVSDFWRLLDEDGSARMRKLVQELGPATGSEEEHGIQCTDCKKIAITKEDKTWCCGRNRHLKVDCWVKRR